LLIEEPELQIELVATNSTENLLLREADIAIRMVQPEQFEVIARRIGEIELGIYAAQPYLDHFGMPQSITDLGNHILLGYDRSDLMIRGMAQLGITMKRQDFAFRVDNQVTYQEALRAGVGLGVSQKRQAQIYALVPVFPHLTIPPLPVWLATHAEMRSSARVRRVYDFLAARLPALL
jgi:DNA-binding transcriptional LysR family regulator